jgi:hypothetical protein
MPKRILTLTFEVEAEKAENLPSGDALRDALEEGLHDDWWSNPDEDGWSLVSIGNTGKVEDVEGGEV